MELVAPCARNFPAMRDPMLELRRAHAACSDRQLLALIDATDTAPQVDRGWIVEFEAMLVWEWNRRTGCEYRLRLPESVGAEWVSVMLKVFDNGSPPVRALFNALVELLTSRVGAQATDVGPPARRAPGESDRNLGGGSVLSGHDPDGECKLKELGEAYQNARFTGGRSAFDRLLSRSRPSEGPQLSHGAWLGCLRRGVLVERLGECLVDYN